MCMRKKPADPGVESRLACSQLKAERLYALTHTVSYWYIQNYWLQKHTYKIPAHKQAVWCHFVYTRCMQHYPAIIPTNHLETRDNKIPTGWCANICTSTLYNCACDLSHGDRLIQGSGNTHLEKASLFRNRLFMLEANYNSRLQPVILSLSSSNLWRKPLNSDLDVLLAPWCS